ncbi:hypothetical protein HDV00_011602 [Rhizophlyctis rosea]|nr:hypothetical protein HDV00_011602 [Rhizophlyctis rosea]
MIPSLPPELISPIAQTADPTSSRNLRATCKDFRALISLADLIWAEGGWRHFTRGLDNCWQWALRNWHTKVLWAYIDDVEPKDRRAFFLHAVDRGDQDTFLELMRETGLDGFGIKATLLREALFVAARREDLHLVRASLDAEASDGELESVESLPGWSLSDRDQARPQNIRALHFPTGAEVTDLLLASGTYPSNIQESTLTRAVVAGQAGKVSSLLKAGTSVRWNMLQTAAHIGFLNVVESLLEAEPDIRKDEALYAAAIRGHVKVVRVLLEAGANVHRFSSLLRAVNARGNSEVIKVLVDAGARGHYRPETLG